MRRLALLACLIALPALGQTPDYSRQTLVKIFAPHEIDLPPRPPARVQWHLGYVDFRALGMDWRVAYLPIAAPLAGTRLNETATLPNAFALTNTPIANSRPLVLDEPSHEVRAEVRRIRRRTGL